MRLSKKSVSFFLCSLIFSASIYFYAIQGFSISFQSPNIIEEIQAFDQKLKSFKADFKEIRTFAYDPEKEVATGALYFSKPARIRWDYISPSKKEVVLTEKKAWVYIPNIKQVQLFNVEGKVKYESLPIGLRGPSQDLNKNYQVTIAPAKGGDEGSLFLMELIPRKHTTAALYYTSIKLWLREGRWIPAEKIELKEVAGDSSLFELKNIVINTKLSAKLFKFNFPADVEVVDHSQKEQN
jgi:outer membrane lipoprotein carrier protein